jgi:starch synthase
MNILFAASEAAPFIASGGLADVAGSLPRAIKEKGHDCRVVIPLYSGISEEMRSELKFLCNFKVKVAWREQYCGVFTGTAGGVTYYFIDNEYYFSRQGLYGFYDDCERFVFFSRAVLDMIRILKTTVDEKDRFSPDIIHSNDWQTALIPVYYQIFYKYLDEYSGIKNVFTIHNIQYQGKYGTEVVSELLGIPSFNYSILDYMNCVNLMKGAIETADKITTVSPTYAKEILDPYYSHGLDIILRNKQGNLCGFLNGIDTDFYNPETDKAVAKNYSAKNPEGKKECKKALISELGLADGPEPVVGIITRFVSHKGIDLVRYVFEDMVRAGFKFAILGSGEKIYEDFFAEMAWRYPDKVSVTLGFKPDLARRIYSGADLFLMPSQSEPCGLAQMLSTRYGTPAIVRQTGGLKDSISDCGTPGGIGFTFKTYNAHDMFSACQRAMGYYYSDEWENLVKHVMEVDFSWRYSAELYLGLYRELVGDI